MQSDKIKNTEEKAEKTEVCEVTSEYKKQRFGLKIFPETLEIVDTLFKHDNCKSRSEFIEKAVRFYCGYLLNKEHTATEFIAPQLTAMAEGIVKGTEQRLSRALFKMCQYHLTHFIRTRIMQRERYDHSRAFFELPEAAHRWRCRFFCWPSNS